MAGRPQGRTWADVRRPRNLPSPPPPRLVLAWESSGGEQGQAAGMGGTCGCWEPLRSLGRSGRQPGTRAGGQEPVGAAARTRTWDMGPDPWGPASPLTCLMGPIGMHLTLAFGRRFPEQVALDRHLVHSSDAEPGLRSVHLGEEEDTVQEG